ncbi:MAG: DUF4139 domain-containing protein [Methylophaga sp.]|nr:DUF4139 domain-containing protein [Methylophaga sp.]
MKSPLTLLSLSLLFTMPTFASDIEQRTTLNDQSAVAVTIYNENIALIKDQRKITLDKGFNKISFRGVSARMRPETALLRSLNPNNNVHVLEQNFDFDLLTPQKLLEKSVGKHVKLARTNPATGIETIEKATVLSTNGGVVLKIGDKIITNPQGQYIFDNVPDNLRDQPTLVIQLTSSTDKTQTVELGYLTGGLSWKADYVAELSSDDSHLDLTGWVTLNNQSGTYYNNAKLQLVAGDVNQVRPQLLGRSTPRMALEMKMDVVDNMAEESLFEYHLYTLGRNTDLADKQTKQVALLSASSVPVTKQFLLQGNSYYYNSSYGQLGQKMKVGVFVEFKNTEKTQLGMPIPKGIVRVYKNDSKGNAQFVGEDGIDHTPKNEDIRLKLGDAFDVTANKKQTDFKKVHHSTPHHTAYESAFEVELKNAKSAPVTVTVREPIPGDWKVIKENIPHSKAASGTAEWQVTIPAESSKTLRYRVLVQH